MVSPLPRIITLEQAKKAARITTVEDDDDLYLRLEIAHELVLDYVNNRVDVDEDSTVAEDWLDTILAWDVDNAPRRIKGAILATFVYLQRFRGDDDEKSRQALQDAQLPDHVRMMLGRLRDPTVA